MTIKFNRDQLTNIPVDAAARATMAVIDGVQQLPPQDQLAGITAAFKLLTEHYRVDAQDAFTIANNVMHDADGRRIEFKAVQMYMENEL